jgi:hypothetical protein
MWLTWTLQAVQVSRGTTHAILLGAVTDPAPMAKDKYAMRSRREKIEAERAAGLGVKLNPDCGNRAVPGYDECEEHMPPGRYIGRWAANQPVPSKSN